MLRVEFFEMFECRIGENVCISLILLTMAQLLHAHQAMLMKRTDNPPLAFGERIPEEYSGLVSRTGECVRVTTYQKDDCSNLD